MISKREMRQQPFEENENRKVGALSTVLAELYEPCNNLEQLITYIFTFYYLEGLNITHGSMSRRTAMAVHDKLRSGLNFIQDYFWYINHSHMCDKIITTCLRNKLVECFFAFLQKGVQEITPLLLNLQEL